MMFFSGLLLSESLRLVLLTSNSTISVLMTGKSSGLKILPNDYNILLKVQRGEFQFSLVVVPVF